MVKEVVNDLAKCVALLLPGFDSVSVCLFDESTIETGDDWEELLADEVNAARVLICLMSPNYFSRPHCAKEFDVFRRRIDQYDATAATGLPILPILWRSPTE